jgi:plastocyanin domain-containing protein
MNTSEYIVVAGGIAAIAFIVWYFFGKREAVAAADVGGVQEIKITVKGGYSPDVVVVKAGRPVRLNFYRDETAACTEDVVIPEFRIAKHLPAFQTTPIEFTPEKAGEFPFACGMNMVRGKLVVEE